MRHSKIIGGLALGRFYPELADSMLLCATEMTKRTDMDELAAEVGRTPWSATGPPASLPEAQA